ncbi:hypothetical protein V6N12_002645 [Hibiscus sabdariffa]|uniref:Uncharacterized protein n=1 Tax=Hibiscus sabdariffa TaxID=183260 RepID=A0ABR2E9K8_9ROSI
MIKVNKEPVVAAAVTGEGSSAGENGTKRGTELTPTQRQEPWSKGTDNTTTKCGSWSLRSSRRPDLVQRNPTPPLL